MKTAHCPTFSLFGGVHLTGGGLEDQTFTVCKGFWSVTIRLRLLSGGWAYCLHFKIVGAVFKLSPTFGCDISYASALTLSNLYGMSLLSSSPSVSSIFQCFSEQQSFFYQSLSNAIERYPGIAL